MRGDCPRAVVFDWLNNADMVLVCFRPRVLWYNLRAHALLLGQRQIPGTS